MKFKYLCAISAFCFAGVAQAQTAQWETDTIHMNANYSNNVYYSLENGSVKTNLNNSWDIGFRTDLMATGVYANHAGAGIQVFPLTGLSAATKFGSDLTLDTVGLTNIDSAIYNSITTWDTGAFNQNKDLTNVFDLGWGMYDLNTHLIQGDKIYLLKTPTAAYQLWIESDDPFTDPNVPKWIFHIANLDGTNAKTKTHHSNPLYTNKLMAYYNIANDEFLNLDPDNEDWDFEFTRYTEKVSQGPVTMMYPVTGVLSNMGRPTIKFRGMEALNAVWDNSLTSQMTTTINNIGRDWKMPTQTAGVYDLDTVTYFMKNSHNDIWQFEFTYATVGSSSAGVTPGEIVLRKRKIFSSSAIQDVPNRIQQMVLVPNPAQNATTLLIDSKEAMAQAKITITDISGRVLFEKSQSLQIGLQKIALDISRFTSGLYFVNLNAKGIKTTSKLLIQ